MKHSIARLLLVIAAIFPGLLKSQELTSNYQSVREHLLMDFGWRFALGNASSFEKDYYSGTSYFTYFAKTGNGDGPASRSFEDRTWRQVDLPHDWAVELPFSANASHSHGYKTIGWKYPETSVGWYRKSFFIPGSDLGKKISIQFDGVFRNSIVWVNGFYLGQEHSGYAGFEYDITDYLNYGGENVVAVRVDASIEEGWFYEGAGIYRHTWLNKTSKLHVASNGTFVTSEVGNGNAELTVRTSVKNQDLKASGFTIEQTLLDANGKEVSKSSSSPQTLPAVTNNTYFSKLKVESPRLWSLEDPYLYKLVTRIISDGKTVDSYQTTVGIRTIKFDANHGFFLNGKNIKLKGVNQHQDHAGVGVAIPDALQEFRVKRLKEMGCNAIRTSHNPATPEFLDICDRLGVLVLEENRLQGINAEHFDLVKRMMERDRNHPSIVVWSLGNEEWAIEGNIFGERITRTMQAFAQTLDSSRRFTVAISGGCGNGSSRAIDVMGFNYLAQCDIDEYHKKFPDQPGIGTEETSGCGTRGIFEDDKNNGHMAQFDRTGGVSIERGWKFYDERPWLSGLFYWTGFDYKGEPNPLGFPAVSSEFGIVDVCGFPKDAFYYLKSWWGTEPVLHLTPHWNWKGKEGKEISVWAYGNCDEVELFLNKKSLGKKPMPKNSHIEWNVTYTPGTLLAKGLKNGKEVITDKVETTGDAVSVKLSATQPTVNADGQDVSVITVQVADAKNRIVPVANNELSFTVTGPAKIIGVGNGDPASHEPDRFIETISQVKIEGLKMKKATENETASLVGDNDDANWTQPFRQQKNFGEKDKDSLKVNVIRGTFTLDALSEKTEITLYPKVLCSVQAVYVNGHEVITGMKPGKPAPEIKLDPSYLKSGKNVIVVVGPPLLKKYEWDELNTDPGAIKVFNPASNWKCKLFNGYAQVLVQTTKQAGDITLTVTSPGLTTGSIKLTSVPCSARPVAETQEK